jgi:hypothetical protein
MYDCESGERLLTATEAAEAAAEAAEAEIERLRAKLREHGLS